MDENESGIKKVAHFFLSAHKKGMPTDPGEAVNEKSLPLMLQVLREKRRIGLLWMGEREHHVLLSSVFAHHLAQLFSGQRMIRIVAFQDRSQGSWIELRSYFPALPYLPPSGSSLRSGTLPLTSGVELDYLLNGVDVQKAVASREGVSNLISLSGHEGFLEDSFFRVLDQMIFISSPDRAGLTRLYQALKALAFQAPGLSAGLLLDGIGFSHSEAWHFLVEYQALVKRFLYRSLDFIGLCNSKGILRRRPFVETMAQDIYFF